MKRPIFVCRLFKGALSTSDCAIMNISVTMDNHRHSQVAFCPKRDSPFTQRIGCSVGMDVVGETELYFAPENRTLAVETIIWSHYWPTLPDFTFVLKDGHPRLLKYCGQYVWS